MTKNQVQDIKDKTQKLRAFGSKLNEVILTMEMLLAENQKK